MDEAQYWGIVERAKARGGSHAHARVSTLRDELRALPLEGLISFHDCHLHVYRTLLTQSFAEAAKKAALADEEELVHAAVSWVVSEGEQLYSAVRADVAVLGDYPVRRLASLLSEYASTSYELLAAENIVAVDPLSLDPSA